MSRINLTLNSHQYHHIQASSASLNHSIPWKAAPGRAKRSRAWSEYRQWIPLQFLTAPRMTGKLWLKQPLMKWQWEQYQHYLNSLYLLANQITLTALDDAWKQFSKKNGLFWDQKIMKSMKTKVNEQLARGSNQYAEQSIHIICTTREDLEYGAENVSTSKWRGFQLCLNRARQVATKWSEADRKMAMDWLECEIHQRIPVHLNLFDQ